MGTRNPHDAINSIATKAKRKIMQHANKADAALNASIDIAQRYELVPRKQLGAWVFFDERMKPISVSEDEPSASPFRRGGKWVRLEE